MMAAKMDPNEIGRLRREHAMGILMRYGRMGMYISPRINTAKDIFDDLVAEGIATEDGGRYWIEPTDGVLEQPIMFDFRIPASLPSQVFPRPGCDCRFCTGNDDPDPRRNIGKMMACLFVSIVQGSDADVFLRKLSESE